MSWDQSWVRGISFGSGCFLTLVSVGLKGLVDDDGLGGQDLPGSEDAYLGATFAAGVLCLLVSFKDQLAACCRSSRGSHLPSSVGRRRVPIRQCRHGTAVGLHDALSSIDMARKGRWYEAIFKGQLVQIDTAAVEAAKNDIKRRGCWSFLFQCAKPKTPAAKVAPK